MQRYQKFLDDLVPYKVPRWVFVVALVVVYAVRVTLLQGWYIVTYALAIYILNLFIAFLSPKFDPALQEENENGTTCTHRHTVCVVLDLPLMHVYTHIHTQRIAPNFLQWPMRSSNPS